MAVASVATGLTFEQNAGIGAVRVTRPQCTREEVRVARRVVEALDVSDTNFNIARTARTHEDWKFVLSMRSKTMLKCFESDTRAEACRAVEVALIVFSVAFECGLGPVPYVYAPEVFPTHLRAAGVGAALCAALFFRGSCWAT